VQLALGCFPEQAGVDGGRGGFAQDVLGALERDGQVLEVLRASRGAGLGAPGNRRGAQRGRAPAALGLREASKEDVSSRSEEHYARGGLRAT
jgi:hypothetical protein